MKDLPSVRLDSFSDGSFGRSFRFKGLQREIVALTPAEVLPALEQVEAAVNRGLHAAGFVSFEAASGINPDLATMSLNDFPLLWFGIFSNRIDCNQQDEHLPDDNCETRDWRPSLAVTEYSEAVENIRAYIAAGDTYQVNFTLRQYFHYSGNPAAYYHDLCRAQRAPFCAHIDLGRYRILSASPELFFALREGVLTTRPMKGTACRGRWPEEDQQVREQLRGSAKERAENLMIVDLLRNDMGMVSETGSVRVESLFAVETLETVHQMTSTITSRLRPGVGIIDLLRALFPCGSVTGAPKRRTMEIISQVEKSPRGLYTGCIGYISPGPEAVFSVAIRTVLLDSATGHGVLGVGSGITYDSKPAAEYAECLAKSRFAQERLPEFQLIESLLFEEERGYFLLERHLQRLAGSANYFAFLLDPASLTGALERFADPLKGSHKVRVILSRNGSFTIESSPIAPEPAGEPPTVAFANARIDSGNPRLYHKTTNRLLYARELADRPDCADVIFLNEREEVCEGGNNNIVARIGGKLVTPPIKCGLLPGVFRQELLSTGEIAERVITRQELAQATELYLINSVRRWRRVRLLV